MRHEIATLSEAVRAPPPSTTRPAADLIVCCEGAWDDRIAPHPNDSTRDDLHGAAPSR